MTGVASVGEASVVHTSQMDDPPDATVKGAFAPVGDALRAGIFRPSGQVPAVQMNAACHVEAGGRSSVGCGPACKSGTAATHGEILVAAGRRR